MKRSPELIPLSREHNTALVLALRITRELSEGSGDIQTLYDDILGFWARGLLPHFRVENECLLARLVRHVAETDELVTRTQRDHLVIEALVADMRDTDDSNLRRRSMQAFAEKLRTHVRWEEDVLFEATQSQLTSAELAALGDDVHERVGDGHTASHEVYRHPTSAG